jgi:hypothetical protein
MAFHRLVTPTYFGGLPAATDYLNTPSDPSVGGTGVPAIMDGKKVSGPNDGSYFVGFTEDGLSKAVNRVGKALGENTDFLDDTLRASIPKFALLEATAVGAVTTVALTGQIFVGELGLANNQSNRSQLIHVTEQSTNDDLEVGGTKIVPTLIHDGASANVVGTAADGFRTNASVNFSPAIPNGTQYRIFYGVRSSLHEIARTEKGAYFKNIMRIVEHINGTSRSLLRQLHSEASVNQAYTDPWDSTIRSLASSGLNERYRRSTTQPAGFVTGNYNVAGGGRVITRDGGAVEIQSPNINLTTNQYPDSQLAALRSASSLSRTLSTYSTTGGGDIGLIHESETIKFDNGVEAIRPVWSGPGFIDVAPRDIRSGTTSGPHAALTFINPTATGLLNPDSINDFSNRCLVQCAAGQYFRTGGNTGMRPLIDMVEVTYSGRAPETYLLATIQSDTRASLISLNRNQTSIFPAVATACTLRWIQTLTFIGGSANTSFGGLWGARKFHVAQPAQLTDSPASENWPNPPGFFAALATSGINANGYTAMGWGVCPTTNMSTLPTMSGFLRGDGSIDCLDVRATNSITTVSGDITAGDDLIAGDDCVVGDALTVGGNASIAGGMSVDRISVVSPHTKIELREDWVRATQVFGPPAIIYSSKNIWLFNEITGTMTLNNGTPSAKNPGQLQIIGAGGSTAKKLSIYPTTQLPYAFANIELVEVVVSVSDAGGNAYASISVGLVDATTTLGNDNLSVAYIHGLGWILLHLVGGIAGAHHFATLGAAVGAEFVVVRFVKQGNGDIQVTFNGSLILTVLAAETPTGNCTFVQFYEQTAGDPGATTWTVDAAYARFSVASRVGP